MKSYKCYYWENDRWYIAECPVINYSVSVGKGFHIEYIENHLQKDMQQCIKTIHEQNLDGHKMV